jgi:glycosyltransferase involved in cell wall biosynthesis
MMNAKPNKIIFVLHLPPPIHGSSIVGESIKNSTIINGTFESSYMNLLVSRVMNETGKTSSMKILRFAGVWFSLLAEIVKKKPELCYLALTASGAAFYKDVFLVALLRLFKIKRVYHLHNQGVSKNETNRIHRFFYRFVFSDAEVILLSKQLYKDVETFVPESRVHLCANGIAGVPLKFERTSLKGKPVKVLFLSNLMESKGVFVLLDACSILQQRGIEFECDLVGAEGDLNALQFSEKVAEKQLSDIVRYLGKKYGKEKHDVFAGADIFIHPTLNDCFPLVLLEAMQYSLPIVSTFEGGIPDIVDDRATGFLVPQNNAEALADKLEMLIKDSGLRQKMGNAGRQKFEEKFTLEIFEHKLNDILKQVVDKK